MGGGSRGWVGEKELWVPGHGVGGEVVGFGQNDSASGPEAQRRHHQLEQVHRSRVGDHHFIFSRADQPCDA